MKKAVDVASNLLSSVYTWRLRVCVRACVRESLALC